MSLKAIVNGTGRGVIGWLSDRYGRKQCLLAVCLILGLAQFGIIWSAETKVLPLFLVFSAISGFGGGAIFPMFAALTADYFGENNNASNYGMVYSSKLVSGLGSRHGIRGRRRLGALRCLHPCGLHLDLRRLRRALPVATRQAHIPWHPTQSATAR